VAAPVLTSLSNEKHRIGIRRMYLWVVLRKTVSIFRDPYRPKLHYMRAPGPKLFAAHSGHDPLSAQFGDGKDQAPLAMRHVHFACGEQPYEDLESERVPGELLGLDLTGNAVLAAAVPARRRRPALLKRLEDCTA